MVHHQTTLLREKGLPLVLSGTLVNALGTWIALELYVNLVIKSHKSRADLKVQLIRLQNRPPPILAGSMSPQALFLAFGSTESDRPAWDHSFTRRGSESTQQKPLDLKTGFKTSATHQSHLPRLLAALDTSASPHQVTNGCLRLCAGEVLEAKALLGQGPLFDEPQVTKSSVRRLAFVALRH